jgi:histidyl-tRNA synthetase
MEQLGGKPTPGCGWALGVDRIALALESEQGELGARDGVFVVAEDDGREGALALVTELRRAGVPADLDLAGRAMKGQMKQADRVGARYALILSGDAKATLRDMDSGEEREVDPATLVDTLSSP